MSLIDIMMDDFVLLVLTQSADGEGGFDAVWKDGKQFRAAATLNSSNQAKKGESDTVDSVYTITTRKPGFLHFHDVIRRVSDGVVFRITSNADENQSPNFGTLDLSQCTAERWCLQA